MEKKNMGSCLWRMSTSTSPTRRNKRNRIKVGI